MISKQSITRMLAVGAVVALGATPVALAKKPEDLGSGEVLHGKSGEPHGKSGEKGKSGSKTVMYVFKGTFVSPDSVDVKKGNAHVKRAELAGPTVQFDLSEAKVVVADTDSSGTADLADVAAGDKVVVKARLPKKEPGDQPFRAKQLIDQTNPAEAE